MKSTIIKRPSPPWDNYFMRIAEVVRSRGNCLLFQVGAVLVKDRQIIATGYNGTPRGLKNCTDGGCGRCHRKHIGLLKSGEGKGECLCVHAEVNAIIQCAHHGISTSEATMYTTLSPCLLCAKEIINAGIVAVRYANSDSNETLAKSILAEAGISLKKVHIT